MTQNDTDFLDTNAYVKGVEGAVYTFFGFVGVIGNAIVITAILRTQKLCRKYPLLLALAGGDICNSLAFFGTGLLRISSLIQDDDETSSGPPSIEIRLYQTLFIAGGLIPGAIEFLISLERLYVTWMLLQMGKQRIPKMANSLIITFAVLVYILAFGLAVFQVCAKYCFAAVCASLACVVYAAVFALNRYKASYIKSQLPALSARFLSEQLEITRLMGTVIALSLFFFVLPAWGLYVLSKYEVDRWWIIASLCFGTLYCSHSSINVYVYATRNVELRKAILCLGKKSYTISSVRGFIAPPGIKQVEEARHQLNPRFQISSAMLGSGKFAESPEVKVGEGYHANVYKHEFIFDGAVPIKVALKVPKSGCGRVDAHGPCVECSRNRKKSLLEIQQLCHLREAIDLRPNPNVVQFLGWSTLQDEKILSVTLFCPWTLLNFLREKRNGSPIPSSTDTSMASSIQSSLSSEHISPIARGYVAAVPLNEFRYRAPVCDVAIEMGHLVSFTLQIASGMDYLASGNVRLVQNSTSAILIHGDLAARNVLLTENLIARITDLGLSYDEPYYPNHELTSLPLFWTAVEVLNGGACNSKSDVWSFAITLREIFTFGEQPYEDFPEVKDRSSLLQFLNTENSGTAETSVPVTVPPEIRSLMRSCLRHDPANRPTFHACTRTLRRVLRMSFPKFLKSLEETIKEDIAGCKTAFEQFRQVSESYDVEY